jgi:hypothetical protein
MENEPITQEEVQDRPDSWWYRVYALVVVTEVVVIFALWFLSRYFSANTIN